LLAAKANHWDATINLTVACVTATMAWFATRLFDGRRI